MTDIVRTSEDRFADVEGYDHEPTYVDVTIDELELRLAHVDAGPADGHTVVLLHGEPTWGYLWRDVLPPLHDAGLRTVLPDLVGFGRSDKPQPREWYSYDRLYDALDQHLRAVVGDAPITLVVHDWGGLLGLVWAASNAAQIRRLVLLDTGLYRAGGRMSDDWWRFRRHVERIDQFPVADMVAGATHTEMSDAVRAAYEAPFPGSGSHGGPLALPLLVPTEEDSPGADRMIAAWDVLERWEAPTMFVWGEHDPIIPPKVGQAMSRYIPTTERFTTVAGSHFLQEDAGEEIGREIADFVAAHG